MARAFDCGDSEFLAELPSLPLSLSLLRAIHLMKADKAAIDSAISATWTERRPNERLQGETGKQLVVLSRKIERSAFIKHFLRLFPYRCTSRTPFLLTGRISRVIATNRRETATRPIAARMAEG